MRSVLSLLLMFMSFNSYATKACSSLSYCHPLSDGGISDCLEKSEWVAVGEIINVEDNPSGHPLNKNFSQFTFVVHEWEISPERLTGELNFSVGWCKNMQELPEDYSGVYRFFGGHDLYDNDFIYYGFMKIE